MCNLLLFVAPSLSSLPGNLGASPIDTTTNQAAQTAANWLGEPQSQLRYRYIDVMYSSIDTGIDNVADDDTGLSLKASYPVVERFYLLASLSQISGDRNLATVPVVSEKLEVMTVGLGGGYYHPLATGFDGLVEGLVTYSHQTIAEASDDSFGYFARGGIRWLPTTRVELELDVRSVGREDIDSEFGFGAVGRFHATNALSLGVGVESLDEATSLTAGLRFSW